MITWLQNLFNKNEVVTQDEAATAVMDANPVVNDEGAAGSKDPIFKGANAQNAELSGRESTAIMETETENLCRALSADTQTFQKEQQAWLDNLDRYAAEYKRLIYSTISAYVYTLVGKDNDNDNDTYDVFADNLRRVYKAVAEKPIPKGCPDEEALLRQRSYVTKFYDHVNLAYKQATLLHIKKEQLDQAVKDQLMPALTESTANLTSQLVSLVALFTALSFIVFGGISSLDSIFSVLAQRDNAVLPAILVAIVWAFCMMNLLFLFMYFVLRIMGTEKEASFKVLVQKHPLVFICNYILLSLLLFLGCAHFAWITGIGRGIYDFVLSHKDCAFVIGLILILAVIGISGLLLAKGIKKETRE